jgi:MYXO-CTERM domain-containing protein
MHVRSACLPLLALLCCSSALAAGRQTTAISGFVFLEGQEDHSGTVVVVAQTGTPTPAPFLALAVAVLAAAALRRRRPEAACGAVLLGAAALAFAATQTTSAEDGAYELTVQGGSAFVPGEYRLDFSHDGYVSQSRTVTVDGQADVVQAPEVTLQPLASETPTPGAPTPTPSEADATPTEPAAGTETPTPDPPPSPTATPTLGPGAKPQDGTYVGQTSGSKTIRILVIGGEIAQVQYSAACVPAEQTAQLACPVGGDGSFSGCKNHDFACQPAGLPQVVLSGRFDTSTSVSGTLEVAHRPSVVGQCCRDGVTFSAALSSR